MNIETLVVMTLVCVAAAVAIVFKLIAYTQKLHIAEDNINAANAAEMDRIRRVASVVNGRLDRGDYIGVSAMTNVVNDLDVDHAIQLY